MFRVIIGVWALIAATTLVACGQSAPDPQDVDDTQEGTQAAQALETRQTNQS